jgi:hypothetical protein
MPEVSKERMDDIERIVADLLTVYGPDGHVDGYQEISLFIKSILEGTEEEFKKKYLW